MSGREVRNIIVGSDPLDPRFCSEVGQVHPLIMTQLRMIELPRRTSAHRSLRTFVVAVDHELAPLYWACKCGDT